jgi:hypothetical protein
MVRIREVPGLPIELTSKISAPRLESTRLAQKASRVDSSKLRIHSIEIFEPAIKREALGGVTCPPKTDPSFELGLARGDRKKWRKSISRANRSSAS